LGLRASKSIKIYTEKFCALPIKVYMLSSLFDMIHY
jgi:hypothetical protein